MVDSVSGDAFEIMLTGGHPDSLGRTIEVVEMILENPVLLQDLYQCYLCSDEVVRLRTSNAFKRVAAVHPKWLIPYIDQFLTEVSTINQASAQWTLAQLFGKLKPLMTESQMTKAVDVLKRNLVDHSDWLVLNPNATLKPRELAPTGRALPVLGVLE